MANPTFVQAKSFASASPTLSQTVTLTSNVAAGNAIVLVVGSAVTGCTATDNQGNVYRKVAENGQSGAAFVALNCAAGSTTITINSASSQYIVGSALEYTNVDHSYGIEASTDCGFSSSGSGPYTFTLIGAAGAQTVNAGDCLIAWFGAQHFGTVFTAGTGFTARSTDADGYTFVEDQTIASPGFTTGITCSSTTTATATLGGFIVLSATPTPITTYNRVTNYSYSSVALLAAAAIKTFTGNTMVVAVSSYAADPAVFVSSVQDTAGNSYTAISGAHVFVSGQGGTQFYICKNAIGNVANVVTANFSPSTTGTQIMVWEVIAKNSVSVDKVATGSGSGTAAATSSFTPTQNNELILVDGANSVYAAAIAGPNYTFYQNTGFHWGNEDKILPTAAAITGSFTVSSGFWEIVAISLSAAASGVPNSLMMMGCGT